MFHTLTIWLAGPGEKLQQVASQEIGALFFLVVIVVSLTLFWKRAFTAFIGFVLFAMVVSVFVFQPQLIKSLGTDGFKWLFEDYLK
ncbi:hypothetical protein [Thermoflavimicrobium daqui]|jgi:hypothetical protein|uniref:Uncharacterized protein n=1 Tax=Thermoflavimicrobium daqui TaxID=2137476 RepID=A0A364K9Q9_9BACL|nr:hypothetical protein [Thermoflavimicrobium daqui]RAL27036.1 hypothetical protein DL897_03085 [Thermoflavimicrobium daqui]